MNIPIPLTTPTLTTSIMMQTPPAFNVVPGAPAQRSSHAPSSGGSVMSIRKKEVDMTGKWKCATCGIINPNDKKRCQACNAAHPDFTEEQLQAETQKTIDGFLGRASGAAVSASDAAKNAASVFGGGGSSSSTSTFTFGAPAPSASAGPIKFGTDNANAGGFSFGKKPSVDEKVSSVFSFGAAAAATSSTSGAAGSSNNIFQQASGSIFASNGANNTAASGSIFASNPALAAVTGGAGSAANDGTAAAGTTTAPGAPPAGIGFTFDPNKAAASQGSVNAENVAHAKRCGKTKELWRNKKPLPGIHQGEVFVCGSGECDQLGLGDDQLERKKPTLLKGLSDKQVVKIAVGGMHALVLCRNSRNIYSWGCNDDGALGREKGIRENEPMPVRWELGTYCEDQQGTNKLGLDVLIDDNTRHSKPWTDLVINHIACGDNHSCAIDAKGRVFVWGVYKDANGYIGFPDHGKFQEILYKEEKDGDGNAKKVPAQQYYPREFPNLPPIKDIVCGCDHTVALAKTGEVFSWGSNSNGQLGQGKRTPDQPVPGGVDEAKDKQAYHDFKTLKKKYLFPNKMHLPPGNEGVSRIGSGNEGTYIVTKGAKSYACGLNGDNQLGLGKQQPNIIETLTELVELRGKQISYIGGGQQHGCAWDKNDNQVYTWGRKPFTGMNVPETNADREFASPVKIPKEAFAGNRITDFNSSSYTNFALTENGDVFAWGSGEMYQLGNVPKDVDNYTKEEKDLIEGKSELAPALMHAEKLKDKYILSVAGGSQHTVILAWNPNLPDNFKRSQAVLEIEQQEDVLSSTALLNEESNKPSRLDSPSKIDLETRSEMNISPRAKRPKLCFSRDVVERCLQEVKKLEKTVWNTGLNRDKAIENLPSLCD